MPVCWSVCISPPVCLSVCLSLSFPHLRLFWPRSLCSITPSRRSRCVCFAHPLKAISSEKESTMMSSARLTVARRWGKQAHFESKDNCTRLAIRSPVAKSSYPLIRDLTNQPHPRFKRNRLLISYPKRKQEPHHCSHPACQTACSPFLLSRTLSKPWRTPSHHR